MIEVFRGSFSGGGPMVWWSQQEIIRFPPWAWVSSFHSFLFWGKTEKFIHLQVEDLNLRAGKNWFWIGFDQKYHSPFFKHPQKSEGDILNLAFLYFWYETQTCGFFCEYIQCSQILNHFGVLWQNIWKSLWLDSAQFAFRANPNSNK